MRKMDYEVSDMKVSLFEISEYRKREIEIDIKFFE